MTKEQHDVLVQQSRDKLKQAGCGVVLDAYYNNIMFGKSAALVLVPLNSIK